MTRKAKRRHPLVRARKRLHLTQADVARVLGVHTMTVSKWERGVLEPNPWQQSLLDALVQMKVKRSDKRNLITHLIAVHLAVALTAWLRR